jgi:hypothetical protein
VGFYTPKLSVTIKPGTRHGHFPYDANVLPRFFVFEAKEGQSKLLDAVEDGTVFAQVGTHNDSDHITVGQVSYDTPFGQGTGLGLPADQLRPAMLAEVLAAILRRHTHGAGFMPLCLRGDNLVSAFCFDHDPSILGSFESGKAAAMQAHNSMRANWPQILDRQRKMIVVAARGES